jgi:hypothetical protein
MPAAAVAIPIIMQLLQAIKQGSQANKLEGKAGSRPKMPIPQGMYDALDIKKNLALQNGLPREDLIMDKLNESSANAMSNIKESATSPWQITAGAQKLGEVNAEKTKDIAIAGAEYSAGAKNDWASALEGLGKLQQDQFMYNDYAPYMDKMNTIRGLREAGNQNLYSGAMNAAGVDAYNSMNDTGDKRTIWDIINSIGAGKAKGRLDTFTNNSALSSAYSAPLD